MGDYRVRVGFFSHHKTRKLVRALGSDGLVALMRLWEFCVITEGRTGGDLSGMTDEDIEIVSEWCGNETAMVSTLVNVGFLDGPAMHREIHDWAEHQPYVATYEIRRNSAKKAADARWGRKQPSLQASEKTIPNPEENGCASHESALRFDAPRIIPQCALPENRCAPHDSALRISENRNAPLPSPDPDPTPDLDPTLLDVHAFGDKVALFPTGADARAVIEAWNAIVAARGGSRVVKLTAERTRRIRRRAHDGLQSIEQWRDYFACLARQAWGVAHLDFDFAIRSEQTVARIREEQFHERRSITGADASMREALRARLEGR